MRAIVSSVNTRRMAGRNYNESALPAGAHPNKTPNSFCPDCFLLPVPAGRENLNEQIQRDKKVCVCGLIANIGKTASGCP